MAVNNYDIILPSSFRAAGRTIGIESNTGTVTLIVEERGGMTERVSQQGTTGVWAREGKILEKLEELG